VIPLHYFSIPAVLDAHGSCEPGRNQNLGCHIEVDGCCKARLAQAKFGVLDQVLLADDVGQAAGLNVAVGIDHQAVRNVETGAVQLSEKLFHSRNISDFNFLSENVLKILSL
jgi:hypothetical protein